MSELFVQANLVGAEWVPDFGNGHIDVFDPATGESIGSVPKATAADVERCLGLASQAFDFWRATPSRQRSAALRRWYDLILENGAELATILTMEQGKPISEARAEVEYAASFVKWYAEEAERVFGRVATSADGRSRLMVEKVPVGTVAAITPWNAPCSMVTRKVAPAVAAGCSVVLKPAESTPFSALALAKLAIRAGITEGVFNVITGVPAEIGAVLTRSSSVRKISFTGSTPIACQLFADAANSMKRLSLEAGGNAPFIVLPDADIATALSAALVAKFRASGQSCVAANRFFIHNSIYEQFADEFSRRVSQLTLGPGLTDADVGPVIDPASAQRIDSLIAEAKHLGATVLCGGQRDGTAFVRPTVIRDVSPAMRIYREEIFGPVAALCPFDDVDILVSALNAEQTGLVAYVMSRDKSHATDVALRLDVGMVGINTGLISDASMPFGGVKTSGIGREGGVEGIEAYLETKYVKIQ